MRPASADGVGAGRRAARAAQVAQRLGVHRGIVGGADELHGDEVAVGALDHPDQRRAAGPGPVGEGASHAIWSEIRVESPSGTAARPARESGTSPGAKGEPVRP